MQDQDIQQNTINVSKKIEAVLFWKGEPVDKKELMKLLDIDSEAFNLAIENLKNNLKDRGLCIIQIDDEFVLRTSPDVASLLEELQKEELNKDLGKATLETLALIIYKGPIKRSEIDNIRGVNSSYILRSLMVRGLIDKSVDPKNARTSIYKPSFELLSHLGLTNIDQLPNYSDVIEELNKFNEDFNNEQQTN